MGKPLAQKYRTAIIAVSVIIPVAVALLFTIRIPDVQPLLFLPPIYATINAITAILLVFAFYSHFNLQ